MSTILTVWMTAGIQKDEGDVKDPTLSKAIITANDEKDQEEEGKNEVEELGVVDSDAP